VLRPPCKRIREVYAPTRPPARLVQRPQMRPPVGLSGVASHEAFQRPRNNLERRPPPGPRCSRASTGSAIYQRHRGRAARCFRLPCRAASKWSQVTPSFHEEHAKSPPLTAYDPARSALLLFAAVTVCLSVSAPRFGCGQPRIKPSPRPDLAARKNYPAGSRRHESESVTIVSQPHPSRLDGLEHYNDEVLLFA